MIYRQTDAIEVLGKDIPPQGRDYALRGGAGQEYFISNRYFSGGPQRKFAAAICFRP